MRFYSANLTNTCSQYCPLECNTNFYSYVINTIHNSESDQNSTGNDGVKICIYYRSLYFNIITQQPKMQIFDVISTVGCILGLFVGMSFVSVFELIEIFLEVVFVFFNRLSCLNNLLDILPKQQSNPNNLDDTKERMNAFETREKQLSTAITDLYKEMNQLKVYYFF